jgi:hypothetical protein
VFAELLPRERRQLTSQAVENASKRGLAALFFEAESTQTGNRELKLRNWVSEVAFSVKRKSRNGNDLSAKRIQHRIFGDTGDWKSRAAGDRIHRREETKWLR